MTMQRRTFLQVLGALGVSISIPVKASEVTTDKIACEMPVYFPDGGDYALFAFHKSTIENRSVFDRVRFTECRDVLEQYGVKDGELVWAKLPLIKRPDFLQNAGDWSYFTPGGQRTLYSAQKIVWCRDGMVASVRKNRAAHLADDPRVPDVLHTTQVAMLHPMNNRFLEEKHYGEVMVERRDTYQ